jgi:hypothetical protein
LQECRDSRAQIRGLGDFTFIQRNRCRRGSLLPRSEIPMKLATFVSAALAATSLAGCGDSMFTAQERGDSILNVRGQAISAAGDTAAATDYEVGVLFMRHLWNWADGRESALDVEFVKGTLTGNFPADFQVELVPPTETYPHDGLSVYESWDGKIGLETFSGNQEDSPRGMRIGHLVVGPKAELAALPRRIDIPLGLTPPRLTFGELLTPYLPTTTITSYQVLYAKGVDEKTRMYRLSVSGPSDSLGEGFPVQEGYTLLDASTFTRSVQWSECAKTKRAEARVSLQFQTCLQANAALANCLSTCQVDYSTPLERIACYDRCDETYPDLLSEYECLLLAQRPLAEAACGPEVAPDLEKLKVLSPTDSLSVRLGEDDVKTGLWVLHSTIINRGD